MHVKHRKVWQQPKHLVVAVVEDEPSVVAAVRRLQGLGVTNDQISLLALDTQELHKAVDELGPLAGQVVHTDECCDRVADETRSAGRNEATGMAVGGCAGLVIGLAMFAVPGLGAALLAAGPVVMAINVLGHMAAGGIGMGMLFGAIFDDRVSEDHREYFKQCLQQGRWLLLIHGDDPLIERAAETVRGEHVERVETF